MGPILGLGSKRKRSTDDCALECSIVTCSLGRIGKRTRHRDSGSAWQRCCAVELERRQQYERRTPCLHRIRGHNAERNRHRGTRSSGRRCRSVSVAVKVLVQPYLSSTKSVAFVVTSQIQARSASFEVAVFVRFLRFYSEKCKLNGLAKRANTSPKRKRVNR